MIIFPCAVWARDPQGTDGAWETNRIDAQEGAPWEARPGQTWSRSQETAGEESRFNR